MECCFALIEGEMGQQEQELAWHGKQTSKTRIAVPRVPFAEFKIQFVREFPKGKYAPLAAAFHSHSSIPHTPIMYMGLWGGAGK